MSTKDVLELLPSLDATLIDTGRRTAKAEKTPRQKMGEGKGAKGFGDSFSLVEKFWIFLSLEVFHFTGFSQQTELNISTSSWLRFFMPRKEPSHR